MRSYPTGVRWETLPTPVLEACRTWVECDLARAESDRLTPLIPIPTRPDRGLPASWGGGFVARSAHSSPPKNCRGFSTSIVWICASLTPMPRSLGRMSLKRCV